MDQPAGPAATPQEVELVERAWRRSASGKFLPLLVTAFVCGSALVGLVAVLLGLLGPAWLLVLFVPVAALMGLPTFFFGYEVVYRSAAKGCLTTQALLGGEPGIAWITTSSGEGGPYSVCVLFDDGDWEWLQGERWLGDETGPLLELFEARGVPRHPPPQWRPKSGWVARLRIRPIM